MGRTAPVELPVRYYLHHFQDLLALVERQYGGLLSPSEQDFMTRFRALSEDNRCLFVRLANRRGAWFRATKLRYLEIPAIPERLAELTAAGFVDALGPEHADRLEEVLDLFTRPELLALANRPRGLGGLPKPQLRAWLLKTFTPARLLGRIAATDRVIRQGHGDTVETLEFLYFGKLGVGMDRFVVRDMGHQRFETVEPERCTPYFTSRRALEDKLAAARTERTLGEEVGRQHPVALYHGFLDWLERHPDLDPIALPTLDRLTLKLASELEKAGHEETALDCYRRSLKPPARERQARLLIKLGHQDAAAELCRRMLDNPLEAGEVQFAQDCLDRLAGSRRPRRVTRVLKQAPTLSLDSRYRRHVEQGVLDHYARQGRSGLFAENLLWRGLLGLLLWDELFDPAAAAIHHPLQRGPSDLFRPEFLERRREAISQRLALLDDVPACLAELERVFRDKHGIANPLVVWHPSLPTLCQRCCHYLRPWQLRRVLWEMAGDLRHRGRGFPDLLLWDAAGCGFVEVKAPGDSLSAQQLRWLEFFNETDIDAQVLRVVWAGES